MTLTLGHYLSLGAMLFALSVIGIFLNRKNLIVLLMAIELMLLAANMNFVAFSHFLGDMHGQVFFFFILTVAAAESAIGLAILVLLFTTRTASMWTSSIRSRVKRLKEHEPNPQRFNAACSAIGPSGGLGAGWYFGNAIRW